MTSQKLPTNRSLGLLFFIVFTFIGLWPIINSESIRIWSIFIALIFFILGIFNSKILTPLNKVWMSFGKLLGNFVSPIVMGIIFFGVVTPTGLLLKLFNKDILNLKKNRNDTYWLKKDNSKSNMKNQF